MSEKVLGYTRGNAKLMLRLFREEQTKHGNRGCFCNECEQDMRNALKEYDKLVPVRLASESVDLKKLKRIMRNLETKEEDRVKKKNPMDVGIRLEAVAYCAAFYDLARELGIEFKDNTELSWAEKEAGK